MTSPHTIFLTQYLIILDLIIKNKKKKSKKKQRDGEERIQLKKHIQFFLLF